MMRAVTSILAALVLPVEAYAACSCECVNGRLEALCASSIDVPPVCAPRVCPVVTPSVRPVVPPAVPPVGTTKCEMRQVLNPYTHLYEWRRVCQ
jgi:hypothetical protein